MSADKASTSVSPSLQAAAYTVIAVAFIAVGLQTVRLILSKKTFERVIGLLVMVLLLFWLATSGGANMINSSILWLEQTAQKWIEGS